MPKKLKKGWRTWRFDQMAVMVNNRIDNPSEAGVDHYVGLEHLDSDSLTIRRWGAPSDVEATKLRFRAGDIIFGRRRVYQRKLGVPDFDGICSAHAMVLRARPEVVLSEFLPFFMQSDLFMERAKQISVGSLSPTINWKTLAAEEFALPPLEEQRRISIILHACEYTIVSIQSLVNAAEIIRDTLCVNLVDRNSRCHQRITISSLLSICRAGVWGNDAGADESDVKVLRSTDMSKHGILNIDGGAIRSIPTRSRTTHTLRPGDILLEKSGGGPDQPVGRVGFMESLPSRNTSMVCGNFIQMLRVNTGHADAEWIFWLLFGFNRAGLTLHHQTQTTGIRNLQVADYLSKVIPVPNVDVQKEQALEIRAAELARRKSIERQNNCMQLKKALLEECTGVIS